MSIEEMLNRSMRYDENSKQWVSREFQRLAEVINDFDPRLSLSWIPPEVRQDSDLFPYAVVEDGRYVIMYLQENELDHRVLEALFNMKSSTAAERIANAEAAKEALKLKEEFEAYEEQMDKAKFLWNSPLHKIRMDGKEYHL